MRVRWLKRALRNLDEEAEYIAADDPVAARKTVATIVRSTNRLKVHPSLGRQGRVPGTRELVVPGTPYIIPYRVKNAEVQILRVFHGARKWPGKL